MGSAVCGPVESQVNGLIALAGEVEQVTDLGDRQSDQPSDGTAGRLVDCL